MVKTRLRSLTKDINLFALAGLADNRTIVLSGGCSSGSENDDSTARVFAFDIIRNDWSELPALN